VHVLFHLAGLFEAEGAREVLQDQDAALFVVEDELAHGGLHDEGICV